MFPAMGFKIFFGNNAPPHKCPKEGQPRSDFKLDPRLETGEIVEIYYFVCYLTYSNKQKRFKNFV